MYNDFRIQSLNATIKQNSLKMQVGILITPIHAVSLPRAAIRFLSEQVLNRALHSLPSHVHPARPPTAATPSPFSAARIVKESS